MVRKLSDAEFREEALKEIASSGDLWTQDFSEKNVNETAARLKAQDKWL